MAHDVQRILRGFSLVAHEIFKIQTLEVGARTGALQRHACDFLQKIPESMSAISSAHFRQGFTGTPPPESHPASDLVVREAISASVSAAPVKATPATVDTVQDVHLQSVAVALDQYSTAQQGAEPLREASNPAAEVRPSSPQVALHEITLTAPSEAADRLSDADVAPIARQKREFRERSVPASPLARLWGFGSMAAGIAVGAASEKIGHTLWGKGVTVAPGASSAAASLISPASGSSTSASSAPPIFGALSEAQAERLAEGLCRMRGAAPAALAVGH